MGNAIIGALAAIAGLIGIMLLLSLRHGRRRPAQPKGDITTSPYATRLADAQAADGYPRRPSPWAPR